MYLYNQLSCLVGAKSVYFALLRTTSWSSSQTVSPKFCRTAGGQFRLVHVTVRQWLEWLCNMSPTFLPAVISIKVMPSHPSFIVLRVPAPIRYHFTELTSSGVRRHAK